MEKRTLKFDCLVNMAIFAKSLRSGYLMNTNNFTITGKFNEEDIATALERYNASIIPTTDKVYSYH